MPSPFPGMDPYLEGPLWLGFNNLLAGSVHLMEIDLLRKGLRVPSRESLPPSPYYVFLSRVERRPLMDVWPITLREPLPRVPVPLLPGDEDIPLDLQAALSTVY